MNTTTGGVIVESKSEARAQDSDLLEKPLHTCDVTKNFKFGTIQP